VEIDYCPACRGVWLDRGELDKILERSTVASPAGQPSASRERPRGYPDDARGHHGGGYGKRKKSWLYDIFD
jgi:uncharacterized protein